MSAAGGGASAMQAVLRSRSTGVLELSGKDLRDLPPEVFDPDASTPEGSVNWWEVCELTKLVASHNQLTALQPEVSQLSTLTTLDLGHNQLRDLPPALCELVQLKVLDVTANRFEELPEYLSKLPSLARLLAGSNALSSLPCDLGKEQPSLAEVVAPGNRISCLPQGLAGCSSLVRLDLQGNQVTSLGGAAVLRGMPSLTELNLRQNRIAGTLDSDVGFLTALKVLDLRENGIEKLPGSIGLCQALVELHVGHNSLEDLPPEIAGCGRLAVLDVRRNRLTSLPVELCTLQLSLLDLTDNNMAILPPQLGQMTSLRKIPLDGNPLKAMRRELVNGPTPRLLQWLRDKIPDGSGALGQQTGAVVRSGNLFGEEAASLAAAAASKLTVGGAAARQLNLSGSGLTEVPQEVWEACASGLAILDLSKNQISGIDTEALAGCQQLKVLSLGWNRLSSWPLPLLPGSLPCLQELVLASNPLSSPIPAYCFASCYSTLRRLDISGVRAAGSIAPGALSALRSLEELIMPQASLVSFPAEIGDVPLSSLRVLNLSTNQIHEVPETLTRLTKLEELDISNNDIDNLPPAIGIMTTLRSLQVEGNRLRTIRRPVLERGTKALLEYLRDRIPL